MGTIPSTMTRPVRVQPSRLLEVLGPQPLYGGTATRPEIRVDGERYDTDSVHSMLEQGTTSSGMIEDAQFPLWQSTASLQYHAGVDEGVRVMNQPHSSGSGPEVAVFATIDDMRPVAITVFWQVLERVAGHTNCTLALIATQRSLTVMFPAGFEYPPLLLAGKVSRCARATDAAHT